MHKIASDGATGANLFTDGNPATGVEATVVDAAWLNAVQTEIVTMVTNLGIALNSAGSDAADQLYSAILELMLRGGRATRISFAIANNQSAAADVTGFPNFDKTVVDSIEFFFKAIRTSSGGTLVSTGKCRFTYDSVNAAWKDPVIQWDHDDVEIWFSIASVSGNNYKLQYQSSNKSGTAYSGTLLITGIQQIRV